MREVGRAVERIDDPAAVILSTGDVGLFFRQDRVAGKMVLQDVDDLSFRLAIDRGNQIDRAFVGDLFRLLPVVADDLPGRVSGFPRGAEKFNRILSHQSQFFRNSIPLMLPNGP